MINKYRLPATLLAVMLISAAVLILTGKNPDTSNNSGNVNEQSASQEMSDNLKSDKGVLENKEKVNDKRNYSQMTALDDVVEGDSIRNTNFPVEVSGVVKAGVFGGEYMLIATFVDLPDPADNEFYEGWIVRTGEDMSVISTGKVEKEDGVYVNRYISKTDLSDHVKYVLTLEPNDGNPAPADHVLEGAF